MGVKVNYNSKKTKPYKAIIVAVVVIFALVILFKTIIDVKKDLAAQKKANNTTQQQATISNYNTIEELLEKYNATFIRREDSKDLIKVYLSFNYDLFTGTTSNEFYFNNIAKVLAQFLDYKTFEMIDEERNITIRIYCEKPNINGVLINGDPNYYLNQETKNNKTKQQVEITRFTIQSPELQTLIDGGWDESKVDWGTKESTCDKYQIYFDEGIKYKVVARNVYNVIFTERYQGRVAGGLTVTSSPEAVISALGNPTLVKDEDLYGYISEDSYLFFDFANSEISVYPVVKISEEDENNIKEFIKELNNTSDVRQFATKLTGLWLDYDRYEYDSDYVDLRYTLKGVRVNISGKSLKNGVFIYQNYSGNKNILDMTNVYMESEDFVVEEERERQNYEGLHHTIEGEVEEDSNEEKARGNVFVMSFENSNIGPKFYCLTGEFPDSELERTLAISNFYWYDDYNFIYDVENEGTFAYNTVTKEVTRIEN